jgi:hypothetical protein
MLYHITATINGITETSHARSLGEAIGTAYAMIADGAHGAEIRLGGRYWWVGSSGEVTKESR